MFSTVSVSSSFIYELLARAHLTYSTKAAVADALEQIIGHLTARQYASIHGCVFVRLHVLFSRFITNIFHTV